MLSIILASILGTTPATPGGEYAIVVSVNTHSDKQWRQVVDALQHIGFHARAVERSFLHEVRRQVR